MKLRFLVPPIISLVASALYLVSQRQAASALQQTVADLRARGAAPSSPTSPSPATARAPIDWKDAARRISAGRPGGPFLAEFQKLLRTLTREELLAAFAAIDDSDLTEEEKSVQASFFYQLVEIDAGFAFDHFADQLLDPRKPLCFFAPFAYQNWVKSDLSAAGSWLDRQTAAGKLDQLDLDGTNPLRLRLEGILFGGLFPKNPAEAEARLASFPPDQRWSVVSSRDQPIEEKNQAAYAALIRSYLPAQNQANALASLVYQYTFGPAVAAPDAYANISKVIERIGATPEERALMIRRASTALFHDMADRGKVLQADFDTLREWSTTVSPERTGEVTGHALDAAVARNGNLSFSEAAGMALHYQQVDGDDRVLYNFLRGESTRDHPEEALQMAGKISDPVLRAEILKQLRPDPDP